MTQEEIIQAITETIVPNGQKGITAESLANLLISMVESSSSGDGALRIFFSREGPISPADLEGMDTEFPDYYRAFSDLFAHNANIYAQIVAARDSGKPCPSVVIDEGVMTTLVYKLMHENYPEDMPFQLMGAVSYPAEVMSAKDASDSGLLGEEDGLVRIIPTGSAKEGIPSLILAEDGGLTINVNEGSTVPEVVEFYVATDQYAITDSNKEDNISLYNLLDDSSIRTKLVSKPLMVMKMASETSYSYYHTYAAILSIDYVFNSTGSSDLTYQIFAMKGLEILMYTIFPDGNATVEVFATLTAPTA